MESIFEAALRQNPTSAVAAPSNEEAIKISVIGVGGGGNNTINRLSSFGVKGANLYAVNTDRQHLNTITDAAQKVLIGKSITKGIPIFIKRKYKSMINMG